MIYLVSHKNPDTDSIVSSLVMEYFLKKNGQKAKACRIGEINRETIYVLDYLKQKTPTLIGNVAGKKIFLIDHNEIEQGGKGIEKSEIIGMMDHHRLGGIETTLPIFSRTEPLGSTSALVFKIFKENDFPLSKKQAALLLAGIISDTLKLVSPTTTSEDKKFTKDLEKISGENIESLSQGMFRARFDISGVTIKELLTSDYKEFKLGKTVVGIAVWETPDPKAIIKKKDEIIDELKKIKKQTKVDLIYFCTLDFLKKECKMIIRGETEKRAAEKSFNKKENDGIILLPGVISRKKQITPKFAKVLGK